MGGVPGAPANVDGLFAGVVCRGLGLVGGGDGRNDFECHEDSPFIFFKATDLRELIGKLGGDLFAGRKGWKGKGLGGVRRG